MEPSNFPIIGWTLVSDIYIDWALRRVTFEVKPRNPIELLLGKFKFDAPFSKIGNMI